jgi:acyl-CoA thioesterase-1
MWLFREKLNALLSFLRMKYRGFDVSFRPGASRGNGAVSYWRIRQAARRFFKRPPASLSDELSCLGETTRFDITTVELEMTAKLRPLVLALFGMLSAVGAAHAATVVALGASNTFGKGVSRSEAYPAQLEALLRARGLNAHVINAGINGDTTGGMLARLDHAVPKGTSVVILQPGGNDRRKLAADNTPAIQSRLSAMGIKVVMLPNSMLHGKPHQPDGVHLTPEGYHMLAQQLVGQVAAALGK